MEKDNNETKIFSKFFWILFSIISILWIIIAIITELDETEPTPIDELIGYNIILLSVWFTLCIIISFLVNIVKKLLKKKNTNDIQLSKEEIETTKLESENHINDNKNMYINDDKITIKENNIIDKKTIVSEKDEMKDKKNNKTNNNSKPLFTCDSIIDAEEYGKMAKYFPRFYWYFVIIGAGINLLITAVIAIISRNLIISLVFFVVYQIYLMILYKVKLEYYAKKMFNPQNMESEIHSEFYDDYFIRQGEIETLKIYYSDINRCIETDTNFYLEFKKRNKVIFIQKNRCELQLIQFIREKFSNIDNRLGDSSKLKRARKTHNTKFIKIFMIILFVMTIATIWMSMGSINIVDKLNPQHGFNYIKNVWVLWCWLPIPITSIVLGYKYRKAGFKCTKNIVAGYIVGFLLIIYGSFSLFPTYEEDYSKIYDYRNIVNVNLPVNGELEIQNWGTYFDEDKTNYTIINAYYDKEDVSNLEYSIKNNSNWMPSKEIRSELRIFIPSQLRTDNDAYFSIYNKTTNQYNTIPNDAGNYEIYAMKYDISAKHLEIHKFDYNYR